MMMPVGSYSRFQVENCFRVKVVECSTVNKCSLYFSVFSDGFGIFVGVVNRLIYYFLLLN